MGILVSSIFCNHCGLDLSCMAFTGVPLSDLGYIFDFQNGMIGIAPRSKKIHHKLAEKRQKTSTTEIYIK